MSNIIKQKERGSLVVISGPSGCGKDTIVAKYLEKSKHAWLSISCTTRKMRPGDEEGNTYYFLTKEEFEERIKNNDFLEYAIYNDNYYGTPKSKIEENLKKGIDVFLVIEVQGALKIKEIIPEAICIFILPPSMKELRNRLVARKTETKDIIIKRFTAAYQEINEVTKYNYVVTNDKINKAVEKINAILLSEKCRVDRIEEVYLDNSEEAIHELLMGEAFDNEDIKLN